MIRSAHFPVSATITAPAGFLERGRAGPMAVPVRYGLLEHDKWGPILIDTGYTARLVTTPDWRLTLYRWALAPVINPYLEPVAVLASRGFRPEDVQHVIVTHLHADHICGLADFEHATIHLPSASLKAWDNPRYFHDSNHGVFRSLLPKNAAKRVAMERAPRPVALDFTPNGYDILGDGSITMVALDGHLDGHAGVAFECEGQRVLYAADAAWTRPGYRENRLPPAPLRWVVENPTQALEAGKAVLYAEKLGWEVVLCHDPEPTRWDISR